MKAKTKTLLMFGGMKETLHCEQVMPLMRLFERAGQQ